MNLMKVYRADPPTYRKSRDVLLAYLKVPKMNKKLMIFGRLFLTHVHVKMLPKSIQKN